jgi:uncharacterized alpha-E superfamily protein
MMLARVADSLYWLGRYVERAEHIARLASVLLNTNLEHSSAADQSTQIAVTALGLELDDRAPNAEALARRLVLDHERGASVIAALSSARENARQVRDQLTSETWERLNLLYLSATDPGSDAAFDMNAADFLHRIIADLHLFKGAADATMSHGDGWRFMLTGVFIERAQLIARLLQASFEEGSTSALEDHLSQVNLLRMACALEPYLRAYTADIDSRLILDFLLFDEDFPRSIRFATARIEENLARLSTERELGRHDPLRLAGRLNARLTYADIDEVEAGGAGALLTAVAAECAAIHRAMYDTFVAYPLETRLPA